MNVALSVLCYATLLTAASWALLRAGFIDSAFLPEGQERDL
jgi:hypothetical protein